MKKDVRKSALSLVRNNTKSKGIERLRYYPPNNKITFKFAQPDRWQILVIPQSILFVKSADHYCIATILLAKKSTEVIRHCSLNMLASELKQYGFIRISKFYLINLEQFISYDEKEKILYFKTGNKIKLMHPIYAKFKFFSRTI